MELAHFSGNTVFAPIPTMYCVTETFFLTTVQHSSATLGVIQQCITDQFDRMGGVGARNNILND